MLTKVLYVSLSVCFILLFFNKTGWLLKYEAYRPFWLPSGTCFFCLGFWISAFITAEIQLVNFNWYNFAIPFLSSVVINFIMISSTK